MGVFALAVKENVLKKILLILVAFSTGALIGDAFIHLIPEITERGGFGLTASVSVLAGILAFFSLEKFLRWRHCHDIDCIEHPKYLGTINLLGDGFHNLIDGMLVGSTFLASIPLGLSTTLAVILHEVPQEMGDFGVLVHSGFSKKKAIYYNFLSACLAIVGALLAYSIGSGTVKFVNLMVPFTAGGFIYIALSGLVPELHKEDDWRKSLVQFICIILGISIMGLLRIVG